ncbi:family of serine hydrolases 3 [[Candida] jaroonii]|uniref:Family of serine hydrolases 3 n=1 Tax=[Candida] jaroonii TaxID=467808 RepID=A0ACA9YBM5_9ASCO|nr:family of serine hydrolases 3 [[Candida] jaroonii]
MKGRILFIHGYTQNSQTFYAKTSALRKKLIKSGYEPVYLNGPLLLTPADFPGEDFGKFQSGDDDFRAWWIKPGQTNAGIDITEAIDTVKKYVDEENAEGKETTKQDIVGVIGFSQGAALGGLIHNKFEELFGHTLKFSILYSGFKLDTSKNSGNEDLKQYYPSKPNGKILHVIGELDTVIDESRALSLVDVLGGDILKHPGGHFVPNSKVYVEKVVAWIASTEVEPKAEEKEDKEEEDILAMMDKLGV